MPRRRGRATMSFGECRSEATGIGITFAWIPTRIASTSRAETHVMIVDENSGKVIGDIPNTMGVHGIALAPDLGKGFTSNGGSASVTVYRSEDAQTALRDQDDRR